LKVANLPRLSAFGDSWLSSCFDNGSNSFGETRLPSGGKRFLLKALRIFYEIVDLSIA